MIRRPSRRDLLRFGGALAPALVLACKSGGPDFVSDQPRAPSRPREVARVVPSQPTMDGAGVRLRRAIGGSALSFLDPFMLLDEFHTDRAEDYLAGFPEHPHRGFETVTYMLHGAMEHRDSIGNKGRLGPGSTQWMTAGRGIVHSEMPKQVSGLMWGFQLWVNLPARLKMTKPRYQDLAADRIPETTVGDAHVRVVAGEAGGVRGPVSEIVTEPTFLDVTLGAGGRFAHAVPAGHNVFAYVIEGALRFGAPGGAANATGEVAKGNLAVLARGDEVAATSAGGGRFLLLAGAPIGEPVARRGPFVMNTEAELDQAWDDYRSGRLVSG
jgi:hypothetical protein